MQKIIVKFDDYKFEIKCSKEDESVFFSMMQDIVRTDIEKGILSAAHNINDEFEEGID